MKKLLYLLALLLPLAGFTQNTRAFYGSSISRSYGVDTLAGFKAVNTNTLGYAGLVAISAADTSVFFTNGTGHASIYNSAGVLRQPQYVGVGGSPDVSGTAYLSLTGTTGGFLTARMTAAQKNAIGSPATGLLIYQTDGTPGFYYYTGSAWSAVGGGSSGLTVGTTTISSGTSLRIPYNLAGIYQEQANFTIGSVASGYLDVPSGYAQGGSFVMRQSANSLWLGSATGRTTVAQTNSTIIGVGAHPQNGGTGYNTCVGYNSNTSASGGGWGNSVVGTYSLSNATTGSLNNGIGLSCLAGITNGSQNFSVGSNTFSVNVSNSASFGNGSSPTANNEIVWGSTNYPGDYTSRYTAMYVGSGKTSSSPASFSILGSLLTGSNNTSTAHITIIPFLGTGTGTSGKFIVASGKDTTSGVLQHKAVEALTVYQRQTYTTYTRWEDWAAVANYNTISGSWSGNSDSLYTTGDARILAFPVNFQPGTIFSQLRVKYSSSGASGGAFVTFAKKSNTSAATTFTAIGTQQTMTGAGLFTTTYDFANEVSVEGTTYYILIESESPAGETIGLHGVGIETTVRYQ